MTVVSFSTLTNSSNIFIRDVLRNNIIDIQATPRDGTAFIFIGQPKKRIIDYPVIIIEEASYDDEQLTISGDTTINREFELNLVIWAEKMQDRNSLTDQIRTILSNEASEDADEDSLRDKSIAFKGIQARDEDSETEDGLTRIKMIDVQFEYYGV